MKCSLGVSNFLEEISSLLILLFLLFLFSDHCGRLSYLSLLFFGTLHSDGWCFLFFLAFSFSSFLSSLLGLLRQLFAILHFSFLGIVLITASYKYHEPPSIVSDTLSLRSNPLNLFVTSTVIVRDLI